MKRLFAAIKIHPSEKFLNTYHGMKSALVSEKIKWVNPDNIHLTLKFFGETSEDNIDDICEAIDESVVGVEPFNLVMRRSGIFGSKYNPRVIWFGFEDSAEIQTLFFNMKKYLERAGFEYDRQNFVPHLTIARIKYIQNKKNFQLVIDRFKEADIQDELIDRVILYESILTQQGPVYEVVEEFPFGQ